MLSIYIAVCLMFICVFNLLLGDVLHQKVHVAGVKLAQQVYDLKLDMVVNKEVIGALVNAHGFMLEPEGNSTPHYFSALMGEKSDIFNYKNISLRLYHRPYWVVESYIFILFNLVIIGAIMWGYRWWKMLYKRYESNFAQATRASSQRLPNNSRVGSNKSHEEGASSVPKTIKDDEIEKLRLSATSALLSGRKDVIVISDDSGITVPELNNEPGIYSARYAGENSSDKQNNAKLIENLNKKNIEKTEAYYTACIAIIYKDEIYTVHGWMHGNVINKELGEGGFGYDPMFIANGFDKTLGELGYETVLTWFIV